MRFDTIKQIGSNTRSSMKEHSTMIPWILSGMILLCPSLTADQLTVPSNLPWLTGPLIAPSGGVVQKGHYSVQPFFTFNANTGLYNSHWRPVSNPNFYSVSMQLELTVGLTQWMDFQINPLVVYNTTQEQSSTRFADLPLGFDLQLLSAEKYKWFPGIKLELIETFPTGKYQKSNLKKRTDISGMGSFFTSAYLVFYKIHHLIGRHYLSTTMSFGYDVYAPVHVKGKNFYGGGKKTRGKVYPGNTSSAFLSFEYSFNKNWVFSLDNVYIHANKTRFSGNRGLVSPGVPAVVAWPSTEQLSFAPAIEYNFNENCGLIAGTWFSAAGRNSWEFRSGLLSFGYYY